MANCSPDEKDITSDKLGAKFGISIIIIIYLIFIAFIIGVILSILANSTTVTQNKSDTKSISGKISDILNFVKTIGKGNITTKIYSDSFLGRFTEWFTKVGNSINSGSVLAILAAGVVI